jgi:hypothetical protein
MTTYLIIGIVSFFLGFGTMFGIQKTLPPKTQIINQHSVQQTENINTSIQASSQEQVTMTVIAGRTNSTVTVNYIGRTNLSRKISSITNSSSSTNARKK